MKHLKGKVIASTNPDSTKRPLSEAEITRLFSLIPDPYIFNQAHDESLPPAGKGYNKALKRLPNGDLAITMDIDLYDEALQIDARGFSLSSSHKEIRDTTDREPLIRVFYDESLLGESFGKEIVALSDKQVSISAVSRVDRDAGTNAIIVVTFATVEILGGFFQQAGKELFCRLREHLLQGGSKIQEADGSQPFYHFKVNYNTNSRDTEVLIKSSQDQLRTNVDEVPDLDSLFKYLDGVLGRSAITRVVVEFAGDPPGWRIVHFVDLDGKLIDL